MHPFFGPLKDRSRRTVGPAPQPSEPPEVLIPMPHLRGTGPADPQLSREHERERLAQEQARRPYPRPVVLNGAAMLRKAATALVEVGLSERFVVGGLAGISALLDTNDRPTIVEMMTLVQGVEREFAARRADAPPKIIA